jgi:hypothetical protein
MALEPIRVPDGWPAKENHAALEGDVADVGSAVRQSAAEGRRQLPVAQVDWVQHQSSGTSHSQGIGCNSQLLTVAFPQHRGHFSMMRRCDVAQQIGMIEFLLGHHSLCQFFNSFGAQFGRNFGTYVAVCARPKRLHSI